MLKLVFTGDAKVMLGLPGGKQKFALAVSLKAELIIAKNKNFTIIDNAVFFLRVMLSQQSLDDCLVKMLFRQAFLTKHKCLVSQGFLT